MHPSEGMLLPFGPEVQTNDADEPQVPEVVPIDELSPERLEAAEAEIEAEEEWPQIV